MKCEIRKVAGGIYLECDEKLPFKDGEKLTYHNTQDGTGIITQEI